MKAADYEETESPSIDELRKAAAELRNQLHAIEQHLLDRGVEDFNYITGVHKSAGNADRAGGTTRVRANWPREAYERYAEEMKL